MGNPNDDLDQPKALAASPARRLRAPAAAKYLGVHRRTMEESRRSWRRAEREGKPELRRGPEPFHVGKRIFYYVHDLDEAKALAVALGNGLSTTAAAEHLGRHPRTLENWRRWCLRAEQEGKPELRRGPKFSTVGGRVLYATHDLDDFLAATKPHNGDGSSQLSVGGQ